LFAEVPARLEAAAEVLSGDGPLYLVAHSLGASMASWYLSSATGSPFDGFVGIGMGGGRGFDELNNAISLQRIDIPVLDLYGEADSQTVLASVDDRKAAQSHNRAYRQQQVPGANHFFDDHNRELVDAVAAWLESPGDKHE
jgi:pimeloyl-ACP methyl ester carboxylesterase